jgi:hypothetical protein
MWGSGGSEEVRITFEHALGYTVQRGVPHGIEQQHAGTGQRVRQGRGK